MRSLPILHWLLFLLALHTPQAQGAPVKTPGTQQCYVLNLIREIINELDKLPVASEVSSWDKVGKGQGRAGRCLRPTGLMGSLPLPLQDFLNSNEKRRLMVRVQPHSWVHLGGSPFTSCLGDLRHVTSPWLASVFSSVNRVNSTCLSGVVVRIKRTLCVKFPDQRLVLSSCSIHFPCHGYNNENDFF